VLQFGKMRTVEGCIVACDTFHRRLATCDSLWQREREVKFGDKSVTYFLYDPFPGMCLTHEILLCLNEVWWNPLTAYCKFIKEYTGKIKLGKKLAKNMTFFVQCKRVRKLFSLK